jgi:hypothetical protein
MILESFASRFLQGLRGQTQGRLTDVGSLAFDQVKELGDEMTRGGVRYHMSAAGATGVAAGTTVPSTAASWFIYNPLSNNVTAFFDRLAVINTAGTGGATAGALWICLCKPSFAPSTVVTASAANVTINNANCVSSKASNLLVASGQSLQNAAAGNWFPIACVPGNSATAVLIDGLLIDTGFNLRGRIAIPPGCGIGMYVVMATANSPVFAPLASWREYLTDLE